MWSIWSICFGGPISENSTWKGWDHSLFPCDKTGWSIILQDIQRTPAGRKQIHPCHVRFNFFALPTISSILHIHQLFPKKGAWKMGYWNRPETWQKCPCSGHRWLSVASPMASKTHCMWQVVGSKPTIFQRWDWPLTNFTYDKCTWQVSGWLGVSSRLTLWLGKFPHTTRIYL